MISLTSAEDLFPQKRAQMQRYPLEERPGAKDGTRPSRIIAIRKMSSARSQGEKSRQVQGIVVSVERNSRAKKSFYDCVIDTGDRNKIASRI